MMTKDFGIVLLICILSRYAIDKAKQEITGKYPAWWIMLLESVVPIIALFLLVFGE